VAGADAFDADFGGDFAAGGGVTGLAGLAGLAGLLSATALVLPALAATGALGGGGAASDFAGGEKIAAGAAFLAARGNFALGGALATTFSEFFSAGVRALLDAVLVVFAPDFLAVGAVFFVVFFVVKL